MFQYSSERLQRLVGQILSQNIPAEAWAWLKERSENPSALQATFAALPRKTGKDILVVSHDIKTDLQSAKSGFIIEGWTADRLARVWVILQQDPSDKEKYFNSIEKLFRDAEVNELIALYSALPLLAYPEMWTSRCSEGIRNNIAGVLTAIMCNNPYPSEYLDQAAWNQLVLKAFFTEKPIDQIIGLERRANKLLATTLSDYAHERWAAHRPVNPQLWRCIGKFLDEELFHDIQRIFVSPDPAEKEAAALACNDSEYGAAKLLLETDQQLKTSIQSGKLSWKTLADKMNEHVL